MGKLSLNYQAKLGKISDREKKSAMLEKIDDDKKISADKKIDSHESAAKSISKDPSQSNAVSTSKVAKRYANSQSMRQWKYDKRWSVRRKEKMKAKKYFKNHDDILDTHIPYGPVANKSPHIIVNHWYHRLKDNFILLRLKGENEDKKIAKSFTILRR